MSIAGMMLLLTDQPTRPEMMLLKIVSAVVGCLSLTNNIKLRTNKLLVGEE